MSVGYRHQVDVPVTDIDDPDDDTVFGDQNTITNDFLRGLDYEDEVTDNGLISKLTSYFKPKTNRTNDYEMLPPRDQRSSDETPTDTSSEQLPDNFNVKLTQEHIVKRILMAVCLVLGTLLGITFFYKRSPLTIATVGSTILSNSTHDFLPTTIMVSLDGFHPHYISSHLTPTLHNMMVNGFGAPYMIPSFPSSTFPNHWTLVTGLFPSEHGIVGNTFFDPKLKKQFINTNPLIGGLDPDFWQGGEPIWTTAKKQGVKTAVHMWPGSEVPGIGPETDFDRYNGSELLSSKVDKVMKWIDRKDIKERPQLILTYVPTIDLYGHKFGIHGPNMTEALVYTDNFIDLLQKELSSRNLDDIVNLVLVSDHGMAPTSNDRLIYLDDLVDLSKIEHIDGWPLFGLRPVGFYSDDEIYDEIKKNLANSPLKNSYDLYKLEDIPAEFEFGGKMNEHKFNYRLAPIWIIPHVGYSVTTRKQMQDLGGDYKPKGVHGYNNTELLMRAIFLADGPFFKTRFKSHKIEPFANTEVYNIICESLNLEPAPNNGSGAFFALNSKWADELVYPDLPFEVEHLVENATYDYLWRPGANPNNSPIPTNENPHESMILEEISLSSLETQPLPKPTDFEYYNNHGEGTTNEGEVGKPEEGSGDNEGAEDDMADHVNGILDGLMEEVNSLIDDTKHILGDGLNAIGNWFKPLGDD